MAQGRRPRLALEICGADEYLFGALMLSEIVFLQGVLAISFGLMLNDLLIHALGSDADLSFL